jgi:hypothetical protein
VTLAYILALIALAIVCWIGASFVWGTGNPLFTVARVGLLVLGILLLGWALVLATQKLRAGAWIVLGLLLLVALSLPFNTFTNLFPWQGDNFFPSSISMTLLMLFCAALIVVALLIASGLRLIRLGQGEESAVEGQAPGQNKRPWLADASLCLGGLLLVQVGIQFYWFMVWDSTYDPLGIFWLVLPVLAVFLAGVVLSIAMPPDQKWIGAGYTVLVSGLLVGVYLLSQKVDFRLLTEERAERLSRVIERYHAREGSYPENLRQLIPRDVTRISEPVILYGEGWCYDGGEGFYRLGYVNRLHWSDPRLIGQVHSMAGAAPDLPPICTEEVAMIQQRYPEFPFAYWDGN